MYSVAFLFLMGAMVEGQAGEKKLPPDGLKALEHPEAAVRYRAAIVLANLGPLAKFAAPELRLALKDKDGYVRVKVAEALWKVEQPPVSVIMPTLLDALKNKNPGVRAAAPPVIALLGTKAKSAVPVLMQTLGDKDFNVRMETILALGELGPVAKDASQALLDRSSDEDFELLEPMLGVALGSLGRSTVPTLAKAVAGKDDRKRRLAACALADMGPEAAEAAPQLIDALTDAEPAVRVAAARGLGKMSPSEPPLADLTKACADSDPFVRLAASLALWRLSKKADSSAVMRSTLEHESYLVREEACRSLATMGPAAKDTVPALIARLQDKEPTVRAEAGQALGKIGPAAKAALDPLQKSLNDVELAPRLTAALAVWQISGETRDTLALLKKMVQDEDHPLRRRAVEVLGEMGPAAEPLAAVLVEAYQDDSPAFRQVVAQALKKIDPRTAAKAGIR